MPMPLVSPKWVAEHMASIKILDGTWHPPQAKQDNYKSFLKLRIPGANFFDIDRFADTKTDLPHMLPTEAEFAKIAGELLGISESDNIVVYDTVGLQSAPRVWWTFRVFGAKNVSVLSGGLPQWIREGYPTATGPAINTPRNVQFHATLNRALVVNYNDVASAIRTRSAQILDARSPGRFEGVESEPRAGLRSGHMPGALNVPFRALLEDFSPVMKPAHALKYVFERHGVDLSDANGRKITTCGSGVTAAFLSLGLEVLGHKNVGLYDGSWAEWAGNIDSSVDTGPSVPTRLLRETLAKNATHAA